MIVYFSWQQIEILGRVTNSRIRMEDCGRESRQLEEDRQVSSCGQSGVDESAGIGGGTSLPQAMGA